MPTENEGAIIPIQFGSLEELKAQLRQIEGEAKRSGEAIRDGIEASANKGVGGFLERLKEYRREETAQARNVRFFSNEIQNLIPVTSGAASTFSKLALVLGGGLGVGSAIELVKWGVETLVDRQQKAAAAAAKLADESEAMWNRITEATAKYQRQAAMADRSDMAKEADAATAAYTAEYDRLTTEILQKQAERDKLLRKGEHEDAAEAIMELQALERRRGEVLAEATTRWNEAMAEARRKAAVRAQTETETQFIVEDAKAKKEAKRRAEAEQKRRDDEQVAEDRAEAQAHLDSLKAARARELELQGLATEAAKQKMADYQANADRMAALKKQIADREAEEEKARARATVAAAMEIAGELRSMLTSQLFASMTQAASVNRRFSEEFGRLSRERRAQMLVETGAAKTYAEAQQIVAAESQAAEDAKTAAAKEGQAQRLAAQAIEWGIRAGVALVEGNVGAAAVYAAAAAAAGGYAASLHAQAVDLTQGRGYTAEENDQLRGLQNQGAGYGGSGGTAGSGERVIERTVFVVGGAWMTEADIARSWAKAQRDASRFGYSRGTGIAA